MSNMRSERSNGNYGSNIALPRRRTAPARQSGRSVLNAHGRRLAPLNPCEKREPPITTTAGMLSADLQSGATHSSSVQREAAVGGETLALSKYVPPGPVASEAGQHLVVQYGAPRNVSTIRTKDSSSRTPLALQLQSFIRTEYRQYLLDNPECSRADTLHIFREALSVIVDRFPEFKSVLHLIRDEYDAVINEMTAQVKSMQVSDLQSKSDRGLHAMELTQLKETLNSTISNQQAQLTATQGLLHDLREQLAASEHTNSLLRYEMERRLKEHEEAKNQIKLLSRTMIEEGARAALLSENLHKKDRELELLQTRLAVLKKSNTELESCLREQTTKRWMEPSDVNRLASAPRFSASSASDTPANIEPLTDEGKTHRDSSAVADSGLRKPNDARWSSDEYFRGLLCRIDKLEFELASSAPTASPRGQARVALATDDGPRAGASDNGAEASLDDRSSRFTAVPDADFPVIREWLRHEGITETDLIDTDFLLPPGMWPTEELSFLKACLPVRNRRLESRTVVELLDQFWSSRERCTDFSHLPDFFIAWLTTQTGGGAAMKELGVNLLHSCQRLQGHPECRALLLLLRGFLPEKLVLSWRRQLRELRKICEESAVTLSASAEELPVDDFFRLVRATWPAKPFSHVMQLRFCAWRENNGAATVNFCSLLNSRGRFVRLVKSQQIYETEEFTLGAVEGIRAVCDSSSGLVPLFKVLKVFRDLDPQVSDEVLFTRVAEASQKPLVEVANANIGTPVLTRLDNLLARFRGEVLLVRSAPLNDSSP